MGYIKDLTGQVFNSWTVLNFDETKIKNGVRWVCQCKCGKVKSIARESLRCGSSKSCGCSLRQDLTGKKIGDWNIIGKDKNFQSKNNYWIVECQNCKKTKSISGQYISRGIRCCECGPSKLNRRLIDLTGVKFGYLKVLEIDEQKLASTKKSYWKCECICGNILTISGHHLKRGHTKSCGCKRGELASPLENLTGRLFGDLTIVNTIRKGGKTTGSNQHILTCKCKCGRERDFKKSFILKGYVKDCGCSFFGQKDIKIIKPNVTTSDGYILVFIPEHPNAKLDGYVLEHVYIMSLFLNRKLNKDEHIHHISGIRSQNNIENLELWTVPHPFGQRLKDIYKFCLDFIEKYREEYDSGKLGN